MHLLAKVSPFVFSVNSGKKAFSKRVFSDHVAQSEKEGSIALCGTKCWVLWDSIGFCSPPQIYGRVFIFPFLFLSNSANCRSAVRLCRRWNASAVFSLTRQRCNVMRRRSYMECARKKNQQQQQQQQQRLEIIVIGRNAAGKTPPTWNRLLERRATLTTCLFCLFFFVYFCFIPCLTTFLGCFEFFWGLRIPKRSLYSNSSHLIFNLGDLAIVLRWMGLFPKKKNRNEDRESHLKPNAFQVCSKCGLRNLETVADVPASLGSRAEILLLLLLLFHGVGGR